MRSLLLVAALVMAACSVIEPPKNGAPPQTFVDPDALTEAQADFNGAIQDYARVGQECLSGDDTEDIKTAWRACSESSFAALERVEETWSEYKKLVDQMIATGQIPAVVSLDRLEQYKDTVEAWVQNQRQQAEEMTDCLNELGFSDEALAACLLTVAETAQEGVRLAAEVQAFSREFSELGG